jgi:hypothetical protein
VPDLFKNLSAESWLVELENPRTLPVYLRQTKLDNIWQSDAQSTGS